MKLWKMLIVVSLAALAVICGVWLMHGGEIYTKTSVQVEVYDELFDETSSQWVEQFVLGLLPSGSSPKEMLGVVSLGSPFLLLILFAVFKSRRG